MHEVKVSEVTLANYPKSTKNEIWQVSLTKLNYKMHISIQQTLMQSRLGTHRVFYCAINKTWRYHVIHTPLRCCSATNV